jgi:integrase
VGKSQEFLDWFTKQGLSAPTMKSYLIRIRAIWDWAIEQHLLTKNPWTSLVNKVRLPSKPLPRPFTREEMNAIIEAFKTHKHYSYYADYVLFLFGTGVRTSEAIGLRWRDLSTDCSTVLISEQLTRGERKPTKTNRERTFVLPNSVIQMLLKRRPVNPNTDALVFTAPMGGAIDDHSFQKRAWTAVLNQLGITYRKPYTTRSTAISLALESGMSPVTVASVMGHDVSTLFSHYAGSVVAHPQLPDV